MSPSSTVKIQGEPLVINDGVRRFYPSIGAAPLVLVGPRQAVGNILWSQNRPLAELVERDTILVEGFADDLIGGADRCPLLHHGDRHLLLGVRLLLQKEHGGLQTLVTRGGDGLRAAGAKARVNATLQMGLDRRLAPSSDGVDLVERELFLLHVLHQLCLAWRDLRVALPHWCTGGVRKRV